MSNGSVSETLPDEPSTSTFTLENLKIMEQEDCPFFDIMPNEIICKIFGIFDLRERAKASAVCHRWYQLLTDGSAPLQDVAVVNIFEKKIWDESMSKNQKAKEINKVSTIEELPHIFHHIVNVNSVKLWYRTRRFAVAVIDILAQMGVRMKFVDLYPYTPELVTEYVCEKLPTTQGMTMRPHGVDMFWKGVDLLAFPPFTKLQTLVMECFHLTPTLQFPETITTFEFVNRDDRSREPSQLALLLPKLKQMKNLEYLSMSHFDMTSPATMTSFLNGIGTDSLPKLNYLILKFCKLTSVAQISPLDIESVQLRIKMLKLDLCYGDLFQIVNLFCSFSKTLAAVSINSISDYTTMCGINDLGRLLEGKKICLHLSVMQNDKNYGDSEGQENAGKCAFEEFSPSPELFRVLSRVEMSFVTDKSLVKNLLLAGNWRCLQEVRFIQCSAVDDELLKHFAQNCPNLRRLSLISCYTVTEEGMMSFVDTIPQRTSRALQIVWKRSVRFKRDLYMTALSEHKERLIGKGMRLFKKTFTEGEGEEVVIWDKMTRKLVSIKDHTALDNQRIICISAPTPDESPEETTTDEASQAPGIEPESASNVSPSE